ncbi:MAG TPA: hypothetical protein VHA13_01580 [Gammaproteobacteria bacterium]|nr:hypothetical protein [Gammaproteobacteria bacterium]
MPFTSMLNSLLPTQGKPKLSNICDFIVRKLNEKTKREEQIQFLDQIIAGGLHKNELEALLEAHRRAGLQLELMKDISKLYGLQYVTIEQDKVVVKIDLEKNQGTQRVEMEQDALKEYERMVSFQDGRKLHLIVSGTPEEKQRIKKNISDIIKIHVDATSRDNKEHVEEKKKGELKITDPLQKTKEAISSSLNALLAEQSKEMPLLMGRDAHAARLTLLKALIQDLNDANKLPTKLDIERRIYNALVENLYIKINSDSGKNKAELTNPVNITKEEVSRLMKEGQLGFLQKALNKLVSQHGLDVAPSHVYPQQQLR